ncbi:hypothetical protein Q4I30_002116 [Leishmania utingensis]|uniref:CW-type domain-containing protein n=1 Tax=Leishmania utingensis TaxID=653362 RepID=A0AAW3ATD5_9TRYP
MEWPLSRVPFTNIVVEGEDGDDVNVTEVRQAAAGRITDALPHEMDALRQSPQQRRVQFTSLPASEVQTVHDVAPMWPELAASGDGNRGQATHERRLALSHAAAVTAAGSSTHDSSSVSKGTVSLSRTLLLRSTARSTQATTETPVQSSQPSVSLTKSSSRRRTLKDGAEAEGRVKRTVSSLKRTAIAKLGGATRQSRTGEDRTDKSVSRPIHARPARPSSASAASTAPTAPQPATSEPPSPPLPSASPEEREAEAHRLTVQAARPPSLSVCFDWWMYLCYYDTHALFTSQATAFEVPLRPIAAASASVFYAELTRCFAAWRRQHWDSLVVLRGAGPVDSGARRRSAPTLKRVVRDPALLEYANAVWYEGLRVQRLMVQLLLSGSHGSWSFEVGCFDAVLTALGAPPSAESPLCPASPGSAVVIPPYRVTPAPPSGLADTAANSPTTLVTVTHNDAAAAPLRTDGLSIHVPTAASTLSLLRVLDMVWNTLPTSIPFRMPVSEMEAPGYYRRTRDPVSLCQLYEEAFCGMTAPTHRACVRQHAHITRQLLEVPAYSSGRSSTGCAVEAEVQARFFSYAHLRERLTTLKANCDDYNGAGSELSQQASALLNTGVKALRDAQAEEDNRTTCQARGVDVLPVREEAHVREAPLSGPDKLATQQPYAVGALFVDELSSLMFPPSKAEVVVPPNLRQPLTVGERTADDSSANGQREGSRHSRLLRLPATGLSEIALRASPPTPTCASKIFWIQCDDCRAWHKLAKRLDSVPDTWTCACLGIVCSPAKAKKRKAKKRTKEATKPTKTSAGRRCRTRGGQDLDSTGGASNTASAAPHNAGGQSNDNGGVDDGDVPLVDVFPVAVRAAAVATAAKAPKRGRSISRKLHTARLGPKKARVALSTPPSSSSSPPSSSSPSSTSSGSSSDNDSRSSSRSDSSDSESDSDSGLSNGAKSKAAPVQRIPPAPRQTKWSTVATHKLPRNAAAAVTAKVAGAGASRPTDTALQRLVQEVAELEGRPLQDRPFDQLVEIKRLEKRLSAMD